MPLITYFRCHVVARDIFFYITRVDDRWLMEGYRRPYADWIFVFTKEPVRSLERDGGERDEDGCRWLTPLARPSVTINTDVRVFPRTSH